MRTIIVKDLNGTEHKMIVKGGRSEEEMILQELKKTHAGWEIISMSHSDKYKNKD